MSTLTLLISQIEQWARDRNLIVGSTPQKQFIKLMEEFGELCAGVSKNNLDLIKDSIGDCMVVLVILNVQRQIHFDYQPLPLSKVTDVHSVIECLLSKFYSVSKKLNYHGNANRHFEYDFAYILFCLMKLSKLYDLDFVDCVKSAYNEIKDRKGKMINGVFVKEADLV